MRNPPPSQTSPNTWIGHKDQGRARFQREEYQQALASYRSALNPEYGCPSSERQIILSNVVACRLKIGGPAQARAAVEEAKQCIALNNSWAKGHVRLAAAYIELGGHSNDACNELQRALALDPGNTVARQMLMRELRRDRHPVPSAPPEEHDDEIPSPPPHNPFHVPNESSTSNSSTRSSGTGATNVPEESIPQPDDTADPLQANMIDESLSWSDRIKFHISRLVSWYEGQSEDTKTVLRVLVGLLILYVAFGGRFGLDSLFGGHHENRGNYERGNAYDRYYHRTSDNDYSSSGSRRTSYDYDNGYQYQPRPRNGGGRSFHMPNLFDGSVPSLLCLAGFAYVCHRNNINPFHALFMLNIFTGNRGRGMRHMGIAGLGYGAARGAYRNRARRNGWY